MSSDGIQYAVFIGQASLIPRPGSGNETRDRLAQRKFHMQCSCTLHGAGQRKLAGRSV